MKVVGRGMLTVAVRAMQRAEVRENLMEVVTATQRVEVMAR